MTRLICLANSKRPDGRCIAGIERATGQWIRPVPRDGDGVPTDRCFVGDKFLSPLHVVEIDLIRPRTVAKYQRENHYIRNWKWVIRGRFKKSLLDEFIDDDVPVLHSESDRVPPKTLDKLDPSDWKSLQLVRPRKLRFERDYWDQHRWRARFRDRLGNEYYLKITDAEITRRLESGEQISTKCLLTVSLTKPWAPADGSKPDICYKLVAAVIEL